MCINIKRLETWTSVTGNGICDLSLEPRSQTHLQQVADLLFGQFCSSFGKQSLHVLPLQLNANTTKRERGSGTAAVLASAGRFV